jgi:tetratricopeptide (TPR) repeat protein
MTIDYCSYHYPSAATWQCRACDRYYGNCCVSKLDFKTPRCILCSRTLQSLGAANTITPFWNILHKFLAYPFKLSPLILMIVLGLLANVISAGLIGVLIGLFILAVSTRYAYAIIEESAHGRTTPPSLAVVLSIDEDRLFLKQIAIFLIMGTAIGLVGVTGSPFLVFLATAFCTLALPASILVLATEKSLASAVNPLLLTQLMARLGTGYFVLYAFINILASGPVVITESVVGLVSPQRLIAIYAIATVYFWFATAYMMGYTMLQYQRELGYRADLEEDESDIETVTDVGEIHRQLTILIIEGRFEEAYDLLKAAVHRSPGELSLQQRYNKLLLAMGYTTALGEHSKALIEQFSESNQLAAAISVYEDTAKLIPSFQLSSADLLVKFAGLYQERLQYKNALSLLSQLTKQFPDYPEIGEVFLKAATIYVENLDQPEKALPLIRYIAKSPKFSDQLKQEAGKLQQLISK